MARAPRNNVDYFPHSVTHGKKMFIIEQHFGNDGYALWFKLLEQLGKKDFHYIDFADEDEIEYLAAMSKVKVEKMTEIIEKLAKIGAIHKELFFSHKIIFSEKFIESVKDAYKRRKDTECITLEGLWEHLQLKGKPKDSKGGKKVGRNPQRKEKESKQKKNKLNIMALAFCPFYNDEEFHLVWIDFEKVREKKKAAKSERSYKALLKKLMKYSGGDKDKAIEIVAKSADSGWSDLYELGGNGKTSAPVTTNR